MRTMTDASPGGDDSLVLGLSAGQRSRRHSCAMEDGTLRLFPPMSNRRSFWSADGLGACETVVLLRQQFRLGDQTRQLIFEAQGKT